MMRGLTTKEEEVVYLFYDRIMESFKENINSLYLFGSKARGDSNPNSDIDLLVISYEDNWRLVDKIRIVGYEMDQVIDYKLSIIVMPKEKIDYLHEHGFSFAKTDFSEGVALKNV